MQLLAGLLVALLIGFEAATLRRWTLARRGWKTLGFVVGEDAEMAERRFFAEWTKRAAKRRQRRRAPEPHYADAGAARTAVAVRRHRPVSRSRERQR